MKGTPENEPTSDEIEDILKDFSDDKKNEIRRLIGFIQSLKDLPSATMREEAKKLGKQRMLTAFDRRDGKS